MKTEQEITSRISFLKTRLRSEMAGQKAVLAAGQYDLDNHETIHRLEGNIGALEWVLRFGQEGDERGMAGAAAADKPEVRNGKD